MPACNTLNALMKTSKGEFDPSFASPLPFFPRHDTYKSVYWKFINLNIYLKETESWSSRGCAEDIILLWVSFYSILGSYFTYILGFILRLRLYMSFFVVSSSLFLPFTFSLFFLHLSSSSPTATHLHLTHVLTYLPLLLPSSSLMRASASRYMCCKVVYFDMRSMFLSVSPKLSLAKIILLHYHPGMDGWVQSPISISNSFTYFIFHIVLSLVLFLADCYLYESLNLWFNTPTLLGTDARKYTATTYTIFTSRQCAVYLCQCL